MMGRSRESRVERRWLAVFGAAGLGAFLLHGCHDSSGPEPEPADPDYKLIYTRATGTFTVQQPHGPSLGPMPELLILGSQQDLDSNRVTLSVTFTNTGSEPLADPDGVALFDFTSATGPPPVNRMPCAAPVHTLPEAPPGSCVRDHRGTPGFDGILAAGERSGAVPWAFEQFSGNDFTFHARILDLLDPGEIAGTIFRDLNGNGKRDPGEPGLAGDHVAVTFPESIHAQPADALGRFSLRVFAP